MSKDKYNAPQGSDSEFVDEILAEARKMRGNVTEELDDQDIPLAQARPVGNMYKQTKKPAEPVPKPKPVVNPPTPEMNPPAISPEMPQQPAPCLLYTSFRSFSWCWLVCATARCM